MRSSTRRAGFVVAVAAACVMAACSLSVDLTGFSSGSEQPLVPAEGSVDATDADADGAASDANIDTAPPCLPSTVIDTTFATALDSWVPRSTSNKDYPRVEAFFGAPAAVLLPFVDTTPIPVDAGSSDAGPQFFVPPERTGAVGGVWYPTPVALRAFDLDLEIHVKCTNSGSCADGVGVLWLETTTVPPATSSSIGHAMGLPPGVNGAGVVADNYRNDSSDTSDPNAPSLQVIGIDSAKTPGQYPWVLASKGTPFLAAWHRLHIAVRGDNGTVSYDGAPWITTLVPKLERGIVGISSGTGGQTDAVAVRNVKGSFYDCTP